MIGQQPASTIYPVGRCVMVRGRRQEFSLSPNYSAFVIFGLLLPTRLRSFSSLSNSFFCFCFFPGHWETMASLEALNANEIGIFGLNAGREQNETRAYVYIAMAKLLS